MTSFTITDPRYVDGDPHEVAAQAGHQLMIAIEASDLAWRHFYWAARGAWMTAEEHRTGDMPWSAAFDKTPQGRMVLKMMERLAEDAKTAHTLTAAASYNPRTPVGKHD